MLLSHLSDFSHKSHFLNLVLIFYKTLPFPTISAQNSPKIMLRFIVYFNNFMLRFNPTQSTLSSIQTQNIKNITSIFISFQKSELDAFPCFKCEGFDMDNCSRYQGIFSSSRPCSASPNTYPGNLSCGNERKYGRRKCPDQVDYIDQDKGHEKKTLSSVSTRVQIGSTGTAQAGG